MSRATVIHKSIFRIQKFFFQKVPGGKCQHDFEAIRKKSKINAQCFDELQKNWVDVYFELNEMLHSKEKIDVFDFIILCRNFSAVAYYGGDDRFFTRYMSMLVSVIPKDMAFTQRFGRTYTQINSQDKEERSHKNIKSNVSRVTNSFSGRKNDKMAFVQINTEFDFY